MLRFRAMGWLPEVPRVLAGMAASLLPTRHWYRVPSNLPVETGALLSGIATTMAGAAFGIPGFLAHAHAQTSVGLDMALARMWKTDVYRGDLVMGHSGLSVFTFLLLTPQGWLTIYLLGTGTYRGIAAYVDDPFGEPILTGIDSLVARGWTRRTTRKRIETREVLEGPPVVDRVVSPMAAGIPDCDFAIVSSRRKPGWERGVVVFTQDGCYRLGAPVERTINGRLRTVYPLKEHRDLEAIRRSVRYDLPGSRT
jgi:hypothetical protein